MCLCGTPNAWMHAIVTNFDIKSRSHEIFPQVRCSSFSFSLSICPDSSLTLLIFGWIDMWSELTTSMGSIKWPFCACVFLKKLDVHVDNVCLLVLLNMLIAVMPGNEQVERLVHCRCLHSSIPNQQDGQTYAVDLSLKNPRRGSFHSEKYTLARCGKSQIFLHYIGITTV